MLLIVGLGNPGEKYQKNRHNIGFALLELIKEKENFPNFVYEKKFKAEIAKKDNVYLLKPMTYMNLSGSSVLSFCNYYQINFEEIVVIHDDIDIEVGKIKIDKNRSSAGHKGVESIIKQLKTKDFWRIRVGIGKEEKVKAIDVALKNFNQKELLLLEEVTDKCLEQISEMISEGFEKKTIQKTDQ